MTEVCLVATDATVEVLQQQQNIWVTHDPINIAIAPNASSGSSAQTRIKFPFAWGDATPKPLATVEGLIKRVSIIILTPFDSTSILSVGDGADGQRLLETWANNPRETAEYERSPLIVYSTPTLVNLTIGLGAGNTNGNGFIILEV